MLQGLGSWTASSAPSALPSQAGLPSPPYPAFSGSMSCSLLAGKSQAPKKSSQRGRSAVFFDNLDRRTVLTSTVPHVTPPQAGVSL